MTRMIILHIGSPKCGSTYLQQTMLQNQELLLGHGISYPHDNGGHPGNAADLDQITAPRLEQMFASGVHTVVLSHEDLYSLAKRGDALQALSQAQGIEVQVLVFLRPFSEFIFGDYSQFMKQHFEHYLADRTPYNGRNFKAFAERRIGTLTPAAYLRNWQKRFPAKPLIVDSYKAIRPVMERLLGDASTHMDWDVPHQRTNPSLRMEDCNLIAAAMQDTDISKSVIRSMFKDAFSMTNEPDAGKTPEIIKWIEDSFEAQNTLLLEEFGFDNRRAELPVSDSPATQTSQG